MIALSCFRSRATGATAGQKAGWFDRNLYTDDVVLEIKQADRNDLDAAFAGGANAQCSGLPLHRLRGGTSFTVGGSAAIWGSVPVWRTT